MKPLTNWSTVMFAATRLGAVVSLALFAAFSVQASTYTFRTATFAWHDPVASGDTRITNWANPCSGYCDGIGDDSVSAPLNLGFTFSFAGTNYTQLQVQTDGRVMFNNNYSYYGTQTIGVYNANPNPPPPFIWDSVNNRVYTLTPLPQGSLNNAMVVYGTDVDVSPNGSGGGPSPTGCSAAASTPVAGNNYVQGPCGIYTAQIPNGCGAGCSQFVVTWLNVPDWGDATSSYNFQVIINQDGTFAYQYNTSINPEFGQAEVGYQGVSTTDYVNFNYPAPTSPYSGGIGALAGTAILWYPVAVLVPTCPKFNVFESATPALAGCGLINTKVAGSAFSLNLVAVTPLGVQDNTFSGPVVVDLVGNTTPGVALGANYCPVTFTALMGAPINVTLTAPNDRVNINFPAITDVWKDVRVRVVNAGTAYCSNDNFAIRPASLTVSAFDSTWTTPGNARALNNVAIAGGNVHQAGMPFRVAASAFNAAGTGVTQYNGSPTVLTGTCIAFDALGCNPAFLYLPGGPAWTAGNPLTNDGATYSEAGAFSLAIQDFLFAAVDASDNEPFATMAVPQSPAASMGRFVPAGFTVVPVTPVTTAPAPQFATFGVPDSSCSAGAAAPKRSFTYLGQPFGFVAVAATAPVPNALVPQMTVTAVNAQSPPATTTNYRGVLWKIAAASGAVSPATTSTTCTTPNPASGAGGIIQAYTSLGGQAFDCTKFTTVIFGTVTPDTLGAPALTLANGTNKYPYSNAALATVIPYGYAALSSNVTDQIAFARSTASPVAVAPFNAGISLNVTVSDNSETSGTIPTISVNLIVGANFNGSGTGIAFDSTAPPLPATPTLPAGSEMRYGRMRVDNANGSELLPLLVTVRAETFNGSAFVAGSDNCTTLVAANIARGNFQGTLTAAFAAPTIVNAGGMFLNGTNTISLAKPVSKTGSFNLAVNLEPKGTVTPPVTCLALTGAAATTAAGLTYLQNLQCSTTTYTQDPSAHITFGVFTGDSKTIYMRENY